MPEKIMRRGGEALTALGVTKDATLSQKCGRLKKVGGWRAKVARYLCANWLDPFEQGGHCRG